MFLAHCTVVLRERTRPASSMQNPAAIHMTRKPCIRKESVLKMNAVSDVTSADAVPLTTTVEMPAARQKTMQVRNDFIFGVLLRVRPVRIRRCECGLPRSRR